MRQECNQNGSGSWPAARRSRGRAVAEVPVRIPLQLGKCHRFAILGFALAAASCAPNEAVRSPGAELSPAPVAAETSRPARRVAAARRVRVPSSAPWLTERLEASYDAAPASAVIAMIAQDHPVRLVFEPDVDPLVRRSPAALTIHDHLASVCAQADWTYTVADGTVLVSDIETETFPLAQPPGQTEVEAPLRGLAGAGGESGATNSVRVALDPYGAEVVALVESVLGIAEGGEEEGADGAEGAVVDPRTAVAAVPSANAVVVTARPHQIREVRRVLARMNAATAKTVRIHLAVYEVDVTGSASRSLDLSVLRASASTWGISVAPATAGTNPSTLSVAVGSGGRTDGSTAIFNWLQTAGRTTISFEDTVEARNNQVATVDSTRTRQYVRSVTREAQATGSAILESPTVEIDELRTGWVIHLQPTVAGDAVTVRMVLSRAALVDEVPYSFDEGRIAGTNFVTDETNRSLTIELRDGQTKIVTQLASREEQVADRRTPWLPWLGDGVSRSDRERETVMTVTATVI